MIDNSVDGFLAMKRAGTPVERPFVEVAFGQNTVLVKDNGPGMSLETLETSVRAGWTSQEIFGSLGLYGVGFNIATARLGALTTIWTTQTGDDTWHGLELNLRELARGGTYHLDVKTRTKSNPSQTGTEVEVTTIRPDWVPLLTNAGWLRTNITDRLARIYGTMLRERDPQPIKFYLRVNNRNASAWEHCVWPADQTVYRREEGLVRPVQEIDIPFGTKYVSKFTGEIVPSPDDLPPDEVVAIPERIYGWLGIQRYADEQEYGLDILRNGRKIETDCKDFFRWEDSDGTSAIEYPIDELRQRRGRIVGELHLDHGYVHYTKHKFEREHSSWLQLMRAVSNNEPLTNRRNRGFEGANTSPLGVLFRAFRRNSPASGQTYKDILFIPDNDRAKRWARDYRRGVPEYRSDEIWSEALEEPPPENQSRANRGRTPAPSPSPDPANPENNGSSINNGDEPYQPGLDPTPAPTNPPAPPIQREPLPGLAMQVTGVGISGRAYDIEVYAVGQSPEHRARPPWQSRATPRGIYEVEVDLEHSIFNSSSLQVRDAVLAEVAHIIASEEASLGMREGASYGDILLALRQRYSTSESLDPNRLRVEIEALRRQITRHLATTLPEAECREAIQQLPSEDRSRIDLARARGPANTPLTEYLEMRHLAEIMRQHSDRFFGSGGFNREWSPATLADNPTLLEEYRKRLTMDGWLPMVELGEFANQLFGGPDETRPYLSLIRACINRLHEYLQEDGINAWDL